MDTTGETQVSLTDPDARAMATTSKQPRVVGYNVQSVVETSHHLIVAHEVMNHGYARDSLSMARCGGSASIILPHQHRGRDDCVLPSNRRTRRSN